MGFLNSCWEVLLLVSSYSLSPFKGLDSGQHQQPLPLGDLEAFHPHHSSPGFTCHYPGWVSCNGPTSRDCWIRDKNAYQPLFSQYDITTDYDENTPQGITREYWLEVVDKKMSPDGYLKPLGKVFNGSYPGPLIEACWGDEIVVHVTNRLKTNGTTIHWHGVNQLHTNEMDGVNGVTQCPIAEGDTYTYKFRAHQYGHTWYHSHYSLQYPDGVAGPLLIHGPNSANWDEAWDPILLSDWVHDSAFAVFQQELNGTHLPQADTILLDGTGHYNCSSSDPRCVGGNTNFLVKTFQKGKKYLLRLINASTDAGFFFSIDGHTLQVVSTDFVAIEPYKTDAVFLGIGQRYSVVVEATEPPSKDGNYWMRVDPSLNCSNIIQSDARRGIVRYNSGSNALPTTTQNKYNVANGCTDEPYESLKPVVKWQVDTRPQNSANLANDTFQAAITNFKAHNFNRWDLTGTPLWLNFSNPTILNLQNTTFNPEYAVVDYNYTHGYVYMVITGFNTTDNGATQREIPAAHPIHLHGHDFVILDQDTEPYNETTSPLKWHYDNPPRRDVAMLPINGYLAIAFKPDNPGVWLVHCHIAWHASSGLALQILERQGEILETIGTLDKTVDTCHNWDVWVKNDKDFDQDDSGI